MEPWTLEWTPAPETVLIDVSVTQSPVAARITAEVVPGTEPNPPRIEGWSARISPAPPPGMGVRPDGAGVSIEVAHWADSFPGEGIGYLLDGVLLQVDAWEDLPPDAEEVISFRPSREAQRSWTVTASLRLSDGSRHSADYLVRATNNYSQGRDSLVAAVDARR